MQLSEYLLRTMRYHLNGWFNEKVPLLSGFVIAGFACLGYQSSGLLQKPHIYGSFQNESHDENRYHFSGLSIGDCNCVLQTANRMLQKK